MAKIGLIVAMRTEVPQFLKASGEIYQVGNNVLRVVVSGIGPRKARRAAQQVCTGSLGFHPDLLINSGFCGTVQSTLDIGHLIIANRLAYRDQKIRLENSPIKKVVNLLDESEYHVGGLQTFKWPVLSRAGVCQNTLAVDMESFAIGETADRHQIPAIFLKAVSDIVPEHISLLGLPALVRSLKINTKMVRVCLNQVIKKILENQDLLDDTVML